jgi:SAM-dependent methyltransferase
LDKLVRESFDANAETRVTTGPILGDAFGGLLMDCWQGASQPGQVFELIERDDGYLEAGDAARYFAGWDSWGRLDHWACAQARGRVLDIGCGAGRHALHLQSLGVEVVALDVSPLASEVCRRRGVREIVTGTVFDLMTQPARLFDSFLMLGNNLGLFGDSENARNLLGALAYLATPDAVIIGEGTDPYRTENLLHLAYHERNRALGRLPGQIRMRARHQNLATDWFDYLFTSIEELESLLHGSGWRLERYETEGAHFVAALARAP